MLTFIPVRSHPRVLDRDLRQGREVPLFHISREVAPEVLAALPDVWTGPILWPEVLVPAQPFGGKIIAKKGSSPGLVWSRIYGDPC